MTKINKEGWEIKKLPDIATIQYGYAFDSKCFTDDSSQMPLIRIRDVVRGYSETFYNGEYPEGYIIKAGELLIGMDGEFNIARWQSRDALLNQRVCKITASSENLDEQYLHYFMKVCLKAIEDETPFVTVKHLSAKRLNQVLVNLPPLRIQQCIVEELDEINAIISAKKQQISKLDELAQSIFYDMFGDPVANEKGWEVKTIREVAKVVSGSTPKTNIEEYWDGPYAWITPAEISDDDRIIYSTVRTITDEALAHTNLQLLPIGTVLLSSRAPIGKVAVSGIEMYCNQGFKNLVCGESLNNTYMAALLRLRKEYLQSLGRGATFKEISKSIVEGIRIQLPPLPLQETFAARVSAIEEQKSSIAASIEKIQTLLDARMQEYFV